MLEKCTISSYHDSRNHPWNGAPEIVLISSRMLSLAWFATVRVVRRMMRWNDRRKGRNRSATLIHNGKWMSLTLLIYMISCLSDRRESTQKEESMPKWEKDELIHWRNGGATTTALVEYNIFLFTRYLAQLSKCHCVMPEILRKSSNGMSFRNRITANAQYIENVFAIPSSLINNSFNIWKLADEK